MSETIKWLDAAEIKRSLRIATVLEHYGVLGKLKKRGEVLTGISPFRNEKNPSFSVRMDRDIWNDHGGRPVVDGSEVKGNVIGLVQAFERVSFREALQKCDELLSGGVVRPNEAYQAFSSPTIEQTRIKISKEVPESLNHQSGTYQSKELPKLIPAESGDALGEEHKNEPFGRELKGLRYDVPYLKQRGLSPDRAKFYGVGYASRGLMKGRIVFPIRSRTGELMAYAGRSLKEDDPNGKWRFPNGFHKSHELYGVDWVVNDAETRGAVERFGLIVVEGIFDCLWLREHGYKNVVATLGAEASKKQCELLLDVVGPTKRVTLFYDNDEAGRKGRKKLCGDLIHDAWVRYVNVNKVNTDEKTDPDEFSQEELAHFLMN
jgi:DNA primase